MFFGQKITKQKPLSLSDYKGQYKKLQLTNAALDKNSKQADLYLKLADKEITVCELNRDTNNVQCTLNVMLGLQEVNNVWIMTRNGDVHLCGFLEYAEAPEYKQAFKLLMLQLNTNKNLSSQEKQQSKSKESLRDIKQAPSKPQGQEKPDQSQPAKQQSRPSRLSSRLRNRSQTIQSNKQENDLSKKQKKSEKKNDKQEEAINNLKPINLEKNEKKSKESSSGKLDNGRYSLKSLLANVDDDSDEDEDEDFQDDQDDEDSDDDFQEDPEEQEDSPEEKPQTSVRTTQSSRNIKRCLPEDQIQQRKKNPYSSFSQPVQIVQEEDDQKKESSSQFQQKWPSTNQDTQLQKQLLKQQQRIQQLASKMKIPTKRPTI